MFGSDLSLHGEGPGCAGTGEDAPDVKSVRLLSSLLAGGRGGSEEQDQAGHQQGGEGGGGGGGWEHLRVVCPGGEDDIPGEGLEGGLWARVHLLYLSVQCKSFHLKICKIKVKYLHISNI